MKQKKYLENVKINIINQIYLILLMKICLKDVMMKAKENELINDLREKQLKTKEAFEGNARKSKLCTDMKT